MPVCVPQEAVICCFISAGHWAIISPMWDHYKLPYVCWMGPMIEQNVLSGGLGIQKLALRVRASCSVMRQHTTGSKPGSCDMCAVVGRKWIQDLPVALCNPLPV